MIKIRIRNAGHKIDVQFPISENELYAKLAEIHAIEGRDAPQSAFVTDVYWPEEFSMLKDRFANLDELKSLPKGDFVVMKTGTHPMRVHLKLFFKWGIEFDKDHPYTVAENGNRKVQYANKAELMDGIVKKYHPEALLEGDVSGEGGEMAEPKQTEAKSHQPPKKAARAVCYTR